MTPVWTPSPERVAASNATRFIECLNARRGLALDGWHALQRWSVERPEEFWLEFLHFADVKARLAPGPVLIDGDRLPGARWFPGTTLNFAENLLRWRDDQPALLFADESGARRTVTHAQLHQEVARVAAGLKSAGVEPGDRVAGYLPNLPETVVAMLATTSVGAVWTSCSPDFGLQGVLDRFGQVDPRVLIAADGYAYGGKRFDCTPAVAQLVPQLPGLRQVVLVPYASPPGSEAFGAALARVAGAVAWQAFGRRGARLEFVSRTFDDPLYVMYSSGTTGKPKCIVHGVGGTLLQHMKEHLLHVDLKPRDVLFFFTTCGWMMWNWLASALASGATLALYEGSPFHPDPGVLWRMAREFGVNVFGTSPRYLAALEKNACCPRSDGELTSLRTLLSTGSPLLPENFDFVYRDIKRDVHLASISGGTDIISCFLIGSPHLPVYRGEMQTTGLGMRVQVLRDDGSEADVDEKGELCCTAPFPSVPLGFWGDSDGSKFRSAYFSRFPNIWCHGDYASRTAHDGYIIYGRSDAVLNPGGVRIGTAEIYRQVEQVPEVIESVCIGQDWQGDVRVVLFVRLRDGVSLDESLSRRIRDAIRRNTTPRHVPAKILAVPDIPRTISGKVVELAVRNVVHGKPVTNTDALANPAALEHFRDRAELKA